MGIGGIKSIGRKFKHFLIMIKREGPVVGHDCSLVIGMSAILSH